MKDLVRFLTDDSGQTLSEYVFILGAVALVAAIVIVAFRSRLTALWQNAIANMR